MADSLVHLILRVATGQKMVKERIFFKVRGKSRILSLTLKKIQGQLNTTLFNDIEAWKKHL